MNPGGEPERDESGLPPVDIEIPDDARELDRDVQSYYRELRAERRQQRGLRVRGTLAKDGIVLPLLACCLILALITGTLLTVFTATSDQNPIGLPGAANQGARTPAASHAPSGGPTSPPAGSGSSSSAPATAGSPPPARQPAVVPGLLPSTTIAVEGSAPLPVHELRQAALVLIPSSCNCTATVAWLIGIVTGAHAHTYLVYTATTQPDVDRLVANLSSADRAQVLVASEGDTDNRLRESISSTIPEDGLVAILIGKTTKVMDATDLLKGQNPTTLIEALTH